MRAFFNSSRITALIFLIIGLIFLVEAYNFEPDFVDTSLSMGPMDYPIWLIYGWLIMSLMYFITAKPDPEKVDLSKSRLALLRAVVVIGAYYYSFPYLGLFASSFLFFMIFLFWKATATTRWEFRFRFSALFYSPLSLNTCSKYPCPGEFWACSTERVRLCTAK